MGRDMTTIGKGLFLVALILLLTALVSLLPSDEGGIRMLDVMREPSIYLSAAVAVLALIFARGGRTIIIAMSLAAIAIDLWRIWPYSTLAPAEIAMPDKVDGFECATVLSFNVLQDNDQYERTAALIDAEDPDILFLMETNREWIDALAPQLGRYGFTLTQPLENAYGKVFATRLTVDRASFEDNFGDDTPSLYASLRMADDTRFELIGLHPRPPLPGESTEMRDKTIALAGSRTPDSLDNVLAIGDFNDVPWSSTVQGFVRDGQYLDPRVGRGTFSTFPADYVKLGWPLDQIFVKNGVKVESLRILEDVGSDHLPLAAKVCADPS